MLRPYSMARIFTVAYYDGEIWITPGSSETRLLESRDHRGVLVLFVVVDFKYLYGGIDLRPESKDSTGPGTMVGRMTTKKFVRCEFFFDLTLDGATGLVLTVSDDFCGETLIAEDLVVPFLL